MIIRFVVRCFISKDWRKRMKTIIATSEFKKVIKLLAGVTGSSGHIELSEWYASAVGSGIKMTVLFEGNSTNPESYVVMAKPLLAICSEKKLKEENVEVSFEKENVVVKSGRSCFKLKTFDASSMAGESFIPAEAPIVAMRKAAFELLINRVRYAAGSDVTRPYLMGVHLHTYADRIVSVGLDGHRLARYAVKVDNVPSFGLTIGNFALGQVRKFLDYKKPDCDMTFIAGDTKASVSTDYGSVTFTLLEGEFPEYQRFLPEITEPIELDCEKLSESIDGLLVVAGPEKKITAEFAKEELKLEAFDIGNGTFGEETLGFSGSPTVERCAFNGEYMMEAVRKCECLIEFNADKPVVGQGFLDKEYRFAVMPMRL
jgi:DNA polymerase III sliding clamp (beta) subunit (PCNA family)